jgi:hypothetical protein
MEYVQYGCGLTAPREWTNFDASPRLWIERLPVLGAVATGGRTLFPPNVRFGDIVKGLPLAAQSCRAIYCSHVLEHLSLNDFRTALMNTRKLLREGGVFRLVVPDLRVAAERYLATRDASGAMQFMTETFLGTVDRRRGLLGLAGAWLGNSQHLWMWDFDSLRPELERAGFRGIRQATFADSDDPMFNVVEEAARWSDAVGVQCQA